MKSEPPQKDWDDLRALGVGGVILIAVAVFMVKVLKWSRASDIGFYGVVALIIWFFLTLLRTVSKKK